MARLSYWFTIALMFACMGIALFFGAIFQSAEDAGDKQRAVDRQIEIELSTPTVVKKA